MEAVNSQTISLQPNPYILLKTVQAGRQITSEIVIITLIKPEKSEKKETLHEAIVHELKTNPFWRRWKIEKVTLLEGTQTEPKIEA